MTTLPEPRDHAEDIAAFELWRDAAYEAWDRIAPTYVQADVHPLMGHLRQMYELRVPVHFFAETLEVSFADPTVTKRQALAHTYNVLREKYAKEQ
jgi:hypothetical protein